MAADPDFELLEAWRRGDREAGGRLFDGHLGAVSRFFKNKVDGNTEDLVQETFLACVEGRDRFEQRSTFRTYVFAIARNVLLGHLRRRGRRQFDSLTTSVADMGQSVGSVIARSEQHRLLLRALRHLPADFQITLELFYWEGLDGASLAEVLSISPHTVRSRISRARAMLKDRVGELTDDPALRDSTLARLEALVSES
ncbi:MAG: sigma-70 family RNA polymerase sigma factor [Myxococcota bacterium]